MTSNTTKTLPLVGQAVDEDWEPIRVEIMGKEAKKDSIASTNNTIASTITEKIPERPPSTAWSSSSFSSTETGQPDRLDQPEPVWKPRPPVYQPIYRPPPVTVPQYTGDIRRCLPPSQPLLAMPPIRPRIPSVESYRELFPALGVDDSFDDKMVMLPPFHKIVYTVYHNFVREDFYRYAWLLAQSEERWYAMPETHELAEMRRTGLRELSPLRFPKPAEMKNTQIVLCPALHLTEGEERVEKDLWDECETLHPNEKSVKTYKLNKWGCDKCYEARKELFKDVGWVYLTVVRTEGLGENGFLNGVGLFKVRRHSTRDQAAAAAFYDAAVPGWSTVFACAIRADQELVGWKGKLKTFSHEPHSVLPTEDGVLRVFL